MSRQIDELDAALRARFGDAVLRAAGSARWIVPGSSAGRTIEVDLSGGVSRVRADRIVHVLAAEDSHDLVHLVEVVTVISKGGAEAFFGYGIDGGFGFIGHRISGDGFTLTALDEAATVIFTAPL